MFKPKKTEKKIFKEMLIERIYLLQREREREREGEDKATDFLNQV